MCSLADHADYADECSKLHYFAEKDRLVRLRLFCGLSAIICVICERHWGFFVQIDRVLLREYSPADYADHAERNAASCIISQRKTGCS